MGIQLSTPDVDDLTDAAGALGEWQSTGAHMQLHPGDLGWYWRFGAEATAGAVRTWSRDQRVLAVGFLDGGTQLRLTTAPDARRDPELARRIASDVTDPDRGVLPPGAVAVEAPMDALVREVLLDEGWQVDEPWTALERDLTRPVERPGVRVEVVGPEQAGPRADVQRASFTGSRFTAELWHAMAAGPLYADARCLLAYDDEENPVAVVTVWTAGPGRPGLIEPMGVHHEHRRNGYGTAITVAAAAALREMGSSSVIVCTPTSNVAGVATYAAAGFEELPTRHDVRRDA